MDYSKNRTGPTPLVSVIMPVRNEADFIRRSLTAALDQVYPPECLEVIVLDGMSDDDTQRIVREFMASHPNLVLAENPPGIVPTAMNTGIAKARGEIIIRVDGHTIIENDYVRECVTAIQRSGAENVGGRMEAVGSGAIGEAVAAATSSPFGVGGSRFHYARTEEWVDTVYMGAWPRSVFEKMGLFDEEMVRNQDDEFNCRILDHGGKILLTPAIRSRYYNRGTISSLWRQYFQYGFWKVRVMQKHPRQMRLRHFIPSAFACSLVFSGVLALLWKGVAILCLAVLLSYLLSVVVVAAWMSRDLKSRAVAALPLVFSTLHFSYGLGFLLGNVKFWNRWK